MEEEVGQRPCHGNSEGPGEESGRYPSCSGKPGSGCKAVMIWSDSHSNKMLCGCAVRRLLHGSERQGREQGWIDLSHNVYFEGVFILFCFVWRESTFFQKPCHFWGLRRDNAPGLVRPTGHPALEGKEGSTPTLA